MSARECFTPVHAPPCQHNRRKQASLGKEGVEEKGDVQSRPVLWEGREGREDLRNVTTG